LHSTPSLRPNPSLRVEPSKRPSAATTHAGVRILVIDDDEMLRRVLVRGLRRKYVVTDLQNAESALAMISTGIRFDAILCDLHLCGMSGRDFYLSLDAIDEVQARSVVLLSGDPNGCDDERFGDPRPYFLEKPASMDKIDAMLTVLTRRTERAA
jgi:DNA-binding response OmpR family regulator